jgi:hypothetical protein
MKTDKSILENINASFLDGTGRQNISLAEVGMVDMFAGGMPQGYNVEADVITQTADGRDLNDLWSEFTAVVAIHNERRQTLIDLLTFPVNQVIEDVPYITGDDFEEATEFGVPKGVRTGLSYFSMAYDFKWYDIATRYTWKFLAEAGAQQVESIHQSILEADNRLVFKKVMQTLFRNTNRAATIKGQNYTVFALYNGDGTVPPEYKTNVFDGTHTHYYGTNSATLDSQDVEGMLDHLRHHGYSETNGTQFILMVNPAQGDVIRTWRVGVVSANAQVAKYDFIPSQGSPSFITPNAQGLVGSQPPASYRGLTVIGSYGPALVVAEEYIPAGYMTLIGSGGEGNLENPIGIREHANQALRGLRLIPGNQSTYPLIDSYYSRGFGTGIRQRGAAVVVQVVASTTYTIPSQYA